MKKKPWVVKYKPRLSKRYTKRYFADEDDAMEFVYRQRKNPYQVYLNNEPIATE